MIHIDSIKRGIVIDHIRPKLGMTLYRHLGLDRLDCSIAVIQNVKSKRMGRKDIIKIEDELTLDLNLLGFFDPGITVDTIDDGRIVEKKNLSPPKEIHGVATCKNPRCITSAEPGIEQIFTFGSDKVYRCIYCEQKYEDR